MLPASTRQLTRDILGPADPGPDWVGGGPAVDLEPGIQNAFFGQLIIGVAPEVKPGLERVLAQAEAAGSCFFIQANVRCRDEPAATVAAEQDEGGMAGLAVPRHQPSGEGHNAAVYPKAVNVYGVVRLQRSVNRQRKEAPAANVQLGSVLLGFNRLKGTSIGPQETAQTQLCPAARGTRPLNFAQLPELREAQPLYSSAPTNVAAVPRNIRCGG
nr:hypothetical protein [Arthrobacter crystallopoietes]